MATIKILSIRTQDLSTRSTAGYENRFYLNIWHQNKNHTFCSSFQILCLSVVVSQNRKIYKNIFCYVCQKSVYLALLDYYLVKPVHLKESDKDIWNCFIELWQHKVYIPVIKVSISVYDNRQIPEWCFYILYGVNVTWTEGPTLPRNKNLHENI